MNAAFFGLAGLAALNPKLLIVDLILATNQRPRLMFACFLLGGMGLGITVGLVDVFVVHLDKVNAQNHASGGLDLALGVPLLIVGALLAADHLHLRRRRDWIVSHERQIAAAVALLAGAFMVITGTVRVLS